MGKYDGSGLTDHTHTHTRVLLENGTWGTFDDRRKEREAKQKKNELEEYIKNKKSYGKSYVREDYTEEENEYLDEYEDQEDSKKLLRDEDY